MNAAVPTPVQNAGHAGLHVDGEREHREAGSARRPAGRVGSTSSAVALSTRKSAPTPPAMPTPGDEELEHEQHEPDRQHQVRDRRAGDGVHQARQQVELREPHLRDRLAAGAARALHDLGGVQGRAVDVEPSSPTMNWPSTGELRSIDAWRATASAAPSDEQHHLSIVALSLTVSAAGIERVAEVADATAGRHAGHAAQPAGAVRCLGRRAAPLGPTQIAIGTFDAATSSSRAAIWSSSITAFRLFSWMTSAWTCWLSARSIALLDEVGLDGVEQAGDLDHVDRRDLRSASCALGRMRDEEACSRPRGRRGRRTRWIVCATEPPKGDGWIRWRSSPRPGWSSWPGRAAWAKPR